MLELSERLSTKDACLEYLAKLKWSSDVVFDGFDNEKSCGANRKQTRQCTKGKHQAPPTSETR